MGLFTHLIRDKKTLGNEILTDENKKNRINTFDEYVSSFEIKEELAKNFSFKNIDLTLKSPELFNRVLNQIAALITEELAETKNEEKLDREIFSDLKRINSEKSKMELADMTRKIAYGRQKQEAIIESLRKIHSILILELHTITLMRKKPANLKEVALHFFELMFFREAALVKVFQAKSFLEENAETHKMILSIAKAVILEEELEEEIIREEDKFADEMVEKMGFEDSKNHYRKLGEMIYFELIDLAGAPFRESESLMNGVETFEKLVRDEQLLYNIIKKNRPKYPDAKIRVAVSAFKRACHLGHFYNLQGAFFT
ncbi:hypothetical protein JW756_01900 [Candidatus Woesearchaeota archaeon]|nr:hypothetical protein [Candidatus Woesearchaeota archaeon]